MRLIATVSLTLATAAAAWAEAPSIDGTLPEDYLPQLRPLLVAAVERSPNSLAASIAVTQGQAAKILGDAILMPSVSANASYEKTHETSSTSSQPSNAAGFVYGLSISQPIFEFGAYKNSAAIGDLGLKIAERQYAEAYRLLAASIRKQYLGLINLNIQLRNALFAKQLAETQVQAAKAKFDSGGSSQAEVEGTKLALDQATLDSDRAQSEFDYAKQVFVRLVGVDSLPDASIPLMIPHPDYKAATADLVLAGFVGGGIESSFQSEVYDMSVKQQDLNYRIAKVRLLPKFNAGLNISHSNYTTLSATSISQEALNSETVNIGGTWTIFDGFATHGAKMSALATKRTYELQKKNYVDSTIDSITYMRHQLDLSSRGMSLAEIHNALIADEVKRFASEQSLGFASKAIIDAGVQNLNATEYVMSYARYDYLGRWTDFISLAGIDPALSNISPRYVR